MSIPPLLKSSFDAFFYLQDPHDLCLVPNWNLRSMFVDSDLEISIPRVTEPSWFKQWDMYIHVTTWIQIFINFIFKTQILLNVFTYYFNLTSYWLMLNLRMKWNLPGIVFAEQQIYSQWLDLLLDTDNKKTRKLFAENRWSYIRIVLIITSHS